MVCETVDQIITQVGAAEIDSRLEELLIDGVLYAFQEQAGDDATAVLNCFGTVVNSMGQRAKPYLPQIAHVIKWRLTSKLPKVRQQAADLIGKVAVVMRQCEEEKLMGHLGVVLYEYLSEEYPEVLGSILGALKAIVNVIGMSKMTPPIRDLLPRLTPILKNRHEKVQENCIDLVGRIADRGHEFVPAREWMRICFELLEMLSTNPPPHLSTAPPHPPSRGPQEGHPSCHGEHLWLHRQGHWSARRHGHPAQQPPRPGAPEPCLHHHCHCHCR